MAKKDTTISIEDLLKELHSDTSISISSEDLPIQISEEEKQEISAQIIDDDVSTHNPLIKVLPVPMRLNGKSGDFVTLNTNSVFDSNKASCNAMLVGQSLTLQSSEVKYLMADGTRQASYVDMPHLVAWFVLLDEFGEDITLPPGTIIPFIIRDTRMGGRGALTRFMETFQLLKNTAPAHLLPCAIWNISSEERTATIDDENVSWYEFKFSARIRYESHEKSDPKFCQILKAVSMMARGRRFPDFDDLASSSALFPIVSQEEWFGSLKQSKMMHKVLVSGGVPTDNLPGMEPVRLMSNSEVSELATAAKEDLGY